MDWDERAQRAHDEESLAWSSTFNDTPQTDIAKWISSFRDNHPSEFVENYTGSFNWSCRIRFKDGLEWLVRFAVPGKVMDSDEKIRREVDTMRFIKANTAIPVPTVIAWGCRSENPLNLGAYIIMEFIHGQPLDKILRQYTADGFILRPDVSDRDLDIIYRQVANVYLELSSHSFSHIGALSNNGVLSGPLTLKVNEIESHGGVRVENYHSSPYSSAEKYFSAVAKQDLQHLIIQPNSVDDADDARNKYLYNNIFNAIIPYFVAREYNRGPFKLICDDLRFGNILVNNDKDLKIVAILDWEWAYIAPYQMLFSPPRCLLIKRPSNWDQADIARYKVLAERFTKILEEEDNKRPMKTFMGSLMQQSIDNGQFWFHELVYSCFGSPEDTAWSGIQDILPNIESYATEEQAEVEQFVSFKMEELSRYTTEWAALKQQIDQEKAEFEAKVRRVIEETGELDITRNIFAANCP